MNFQLLQQIVKSIISAIQESTISAVKVLRGSTFSAKVVNIPKTQTIKGTVTVGNQKNLEKEIKVLDKSIKQLKDVAASIKIPDKMEITNFPTPEKYPDFPKTIEVSNQPKEIRISNTKDFKEVSVKNQPTKEIKDVIVAVEKLSKDIRALKLDPKINVEAPMVNIPKTEIKFPEIPVPPSAEEIADSLYTSDPKRFIPVRLSDGEEFYKALTEIVTTASGGVIPFTGTDGRARRAMVDDLGRLVIAGGSASYYFMDSELVGSINYSGYQSSDGLWYIEKHEEDTTTASTRYASNKNNAITYTDAWANKETIIYESVQKAGI
jgi:hypothetical protein